MKPKHLLAAVSNFISVIVLLLLLAAPFYFAKNVIQPADIAGAKVGKPYIIVSQIDKFPNLSLSQKGTFYQITFNKIADSQIFTGILQITNTTEKTQNYEIVKSFGDATVFFGEDIRNIITKITVPSGTSISISLFSQSQNQNQSVEFTFTAN